jgi:pectate lyase
MKKFSFLLALLFVSVFSMAQPPKVAADKGTSFGEKTTAANAITVQQLNNLMFGKPAVRQLKVKVQGTVTEVCQKEGCWIKILSSDGQMMVKMKDHNFAVPVVLNGKTVVIDGVAEIKETTVEELRHFAEDAGKSKAEIDAIKAPKKEVILQARGILVV